MPDSSLPPFDQPCGNADAVPVQPLRGASRQVRLPASGWEAGLRGASGKCPRCGEARLFTRFLKPMAFCPHCGQDWTLQRADDFPAYVSVFLTGHILVPLIIVLVTEFSIPTGPLVIGIMTLALVMMLALLQPAKGSIIALQWWLGLHGFQRERAGEPG